MLAGRRWSVPDDLIASRCTELESGGRMIDAILTNTVPPKISEEFLKWMMGARRSRRCTCGSRVAPSIDRIA